MSSWVAFYLYSVSATGQIWNGSVVGAVLLILLFNGSTWLTEMLSSKKYPAYGIYQQTTSRFIPWFPSEISVQKKRK